MMRTFFLVLATVLLTSFTPVLAQWQDGGQPVPGTDSARYTRSVPDGEGGAIFVYQRETGGTPHIFAQRVDALGNLLWGASGVTVCDFEPGEQGIPHIAPDHSGGAFITWQDNRLPTVTTVYAQHLAGDGSESYASNGIPLVTGSNFSVDLVRMAPMANGDCLVTWLVYLGSTSQLRMQRLSTAGYEWAFGGEIVRSSTNILQDSLPLELSDGRCVAVWEESFDGSQLDVLSMGYDPDGSGAWGPVDVISGPDFERLYDVLADPAGGFFVAGTQWDMVANDDVYLARLDGNGGHAPDSPTFLTTGKAAYFLQLATADEGVWVAWNDNRYLPDYALFVQRMTRGLVPQLDGEGRQVFRSFGQECYLKDAEADGAGGLLLGWTDSRSWPSGADIYTQRVDAAGLSMWDRDGVCLRVSEAGNSFSDLVPDGSGGLLCIFDESIDGVRSLFAQRIERNGYWGYPAPVIAAVRDVPDDQGGQVLLSWDASRLDAWPEQGVDYYTLWGALPEAKAAKTPTDDWIDRVGPESTRKDVVRADNTGVKTTYWQHLGTVIAQMFPGYLEVVPTLADSSSAGPADQVFQVIAHGDGDGEFWSSIEVVGSSVDNLAPGPPQNLAGVVDYPAEAMVLSWDGPVAPDLAEFVIHRGVAADFVPGPSSLVATTPDTSYSDGDWTRTGIWYYKVAAVDVHGNASPYALLEPRDVAPVGDGGGLPAVTALLPNHPNPFNPRTQVVFEVSRRTTLSLRIYDFGGRLVRVLLAAEPVPAGRHEVVWDGRDHLGRRVSAGVYFCHLDSGSVSQTKKMTLLK